MIVTLQCESLEQRADGSYQRCRRDAKREQLVVYAGGTPAQIRCCCHHANLNQDYAGQGYSILADREIQ